MAEQHFAEEFSAEQYREYKPISKAAVGAFICALIGSLAPVAPALLAFEIAAVVLALVALNVIKQQLRSGKTLAFLALLSGTLIIGLIPSRELKRRYDYRSTAREHASSWLQLIQDGRFREAHQLTYYVDERRAPGVSWDEHYRPPTTAKRVQEDEISDEIDPYTAFMDFFANPPASWLKTEHDEGDIQWSVVGHETEVQAKVDCGLPKDIDWIGYEESQIVESEDPAMAPGCSYRVAAVGEYVGE